MCHRGSFFFFFKENIMNRFDSGLCGRLRDIFSSTECEAK